MAVASQHPGRGEEILTKPILLGWLNVRYGSFASFPACKQEVRFTPESRPHSGHAGCRLCANNKLMHRNMIGAKPKNRLAAVFLVAERVPRIPTRVPPPLLALLRSTVLPRRAIDRRFTPGYVRLLFGFLHPLIYRLIIEPSVLCQRRCGEGDQQQYKTRFSWRTSVLH